MRVLRRTILFLSALAIAGFTYVGAAGAAQDLDCADFGSQAEAQAELDRDPGDPHRLDDDNDGMACEALAGEPSESGESEVAGQGEDDEEEPQVATQPEGGVDTGGLSE